MKPSIPYRKDQENPAKMQSLCHVQNTSKDYDLGIIFQSFFCQPDLRDLLIKIHFWASSSPVFAYTSYTNTMPCIQSHHPALTLVVSIAANCFGEKNKNWAKKVTQLITYKSKMNHIKKQFCDRTFYSYDVQQIACHIASKSMKMFSIFHPNDTPKNGSTVGLSSKCLCISSHSCIEALHNRNDRIAFSLAVNDRHDLWQF